MIPALRRDRRSEAFLVTWKVGGQSEIQDTQSKEKKPHTIIYTVSYIETPKYVSLQKPLPMLKTKSKTCSIGM